jgi:hypothetical protein
VRAISRVGRHTWLGLGVCLLSLHPALLLAQQPVAPSPQSVRGVLVDAVSRLPVPRGEVFLTDGSAQTLADSAGAFTLSGVAPGPQLLRAEAFGYLGVVLSVVVTDTLGVLRIELAPDPIAISGLDVGVAGPVSVWGVVLDAGSGAGIPNTSVWLRNSNRQGVADVGGSFRLTRVPEGDDLLLVSKLGYVPQYIPVRAEESADPVEVRLEPDSVVLKGLVVVAQNLKSRRNAYPTIVREYRQDRIVRSGSGDVATFLKTWASFTIIPCERALPGDQCTIGRQGRPGRIRVVIDELPAPAGMDILNTYPPHEIYSVEIFGRSTVRLYTNRYMEGAARRPRLLLDDNIPTGTAIR